MNLEMTQLIISFLKEKINPAFIIVFGSYAKGSANQNSDIDIAFYDKIGSHSSYDLFIVAQELADCLKIEVDLIDIKKASTVLKAQIFSTGKVIYSNDELLLKKQQILALKMYAELNEQRNDILNHIEERGSIYEE